MEQDFHTTRNEYIDFFCLFVKRWKSSGQNYVIEKKKWCLMLMNLSSQIINILKL